MWFLAFWTWRFFALVWLNLLGFQSPWSKSLPIAGVLTALLAIEGVRYKKRLFDLIDYHESIYYQDADPLAKDSASALNAYYGNPSGMAYLVSQALFSAPRTTVFAIKCFRSIIRGSADSAAAAAQIYNDLNSRRVWVSAGKFENCGGALCLLDKLSLIWTQIEAGECQIRIPPLTPRSRID